MSNAVPLRGESDKEIGAGFAPLFVSAQDIPNLTVRIRAGSFWNADGVIVEFPGGNSPTIAAPGSLNRWSLVSLSSTGSVTITNGASSAAPSIPVPPAGSLPLAAVYMTAATTQITNTSIQDVRPIYAATEVVPNLAVELGNRPTFTDVANDLATKVSIAGDETIAGIKTLTDPPVLPSYIIATLPTTPAVGSMALATNANSGNGAIVYFANGIWRDVRTNLAPV